jgi:hypothetical protein
MKSRERDPGLLRSRKDRIGYPLILNRQIPANRQRIKGGSHQ